MNMNKQGWGAAMRKARLRAGLSQEELAKLAGVSKAMIYKWEREAHSPTLQCLLLVTAALEIGLDEYVGNERYLER